MEINEEYMRRALYLASLGEGHVSPNPMVGCVIVRNGKIIGEGWHRKFGSAHAEVNAVESVKEKEMLRESTLYVTLEPCSHFGKTPPCADMIVRLGIPRVVVGIQDPFAKVSGAGIRKMRDAGIDVTTGILEAECHELNRRFFTAHTLHRPYIILKWAQDAGGMMGSSHQGNFRFSTPLTRLAVHRLRSSCDAIITGSGTVISDNPGMDNRLWPGGSPRVILLDRRELTPPDSRILRRKSTLIISDNLPLREILERIYSEYGIISVLVEAGPHLLKSFLDTDLWDECRIETSPYAGEADIPAPCHPSGEMVSTRLVGQNIIETFRRIPASLIKKS